MADHLIPVTQFGELVIGNVIPSCQRCNDSRGNRDWREFLLTSFPQTAAERMDAVEMYVAEYAYAPVAIDQVLTPEEAVQYQGLLDDWDNLRQRAQALRAIVNR